MEFLTVDAITTAKKRHGRAEDLKEGKGLRVLREVETEKTNGEL